MDVWPVGAIYRRGQRVTTWDDVTGVVVAVRRRATEDEFEFEYVYTIWCKTYWEDVCEDDIDAAETPPHRFTVGGRQSGGEAGGGGVERRRQCQPDLFSGVE